MLRRSDDGFRYVRGYRVKPTKSMCDGGTKRWALWERRDGRMRRVGTAVTEEVYRDFLFERGNWARTSRS
jgi:hypothetical protein